MKTTTTFTGLATTVICGLALSMILAGTNHAQTTRSDAPSDLKERIPMTPVFLHPIVWIGDEPPKASESEALWAAILMFKPQGIEAGLDALEDFARRHPQSPWTPSLRSNLAYYYRTHGRYTRALEHWDEAWRAVKSAQRGSGKAVGDFILAHWSSLLASLGRFETLASIYDETHGRSLDGGPLQQVFNGTREGFRNMAIRPDVSYRCGTFGLYHVGVALQPTNVNLRLLPQMGSPSTGFSLARLTGISDELKLGLVPVHRLQSEDIVVPSVVHWKLDHYAAIVEQRGGKFKVIDPTFGRPLWLGKDVINEEASGHFMVSRSSIPVRWKQLTDAEAQLVFGKGAPNNINDWKDGAFCSVDEASSDCPDCPGSKGNSNQNGTGTSSASGAGCKGCLVASNAGTASDLGALGMPRWRVAEPYISLWIEDEPMRYITSYG